MAASRVVVVLIETSGCKLGGNMAALAVVVVEVEPIDTPREFKGKGDEDSCCSAKGGDIDALMDSLFVLIETSGACKLGGNTTALAVVVVEVEPIDTPLEPKGKGDEDGCSSKGGDIDAPIGSFLGIVGCELQGRGE